MKNYTIDPEVNAKVKKNLLRFFIFTVVMIFAGFTSAYIVSQGSEFWVQIKMPMAFNISTTLIILSSVALIFARIFIKKNSLAIVKPLLGFALVLGILFGYFQVQGWKNLFSRGNAVSAHIINQNGRYGQYFSLAYQGKEISFNNGDFFWSGELVTPELRTKMNTFCEALMVGADRRDSAHTYLLNDYGSEFVLKYMDQPVTYLDNKLTINNRPLAYEQHDRLWKFAECIVNNRGDFMMTGKYGEDFTIYYKGTELEYENRTFYLKGQKLSAKQANDLDGSKNKSSSYIYVFTFMHFLHWLGGIIALFVMFIKSLQLKYTSDNYLGIQLGSTYWHFLGILWIYLYAFLIFIH